jgi:copper homeostasis protein
VHPRTTDAAASVPLLEVIACTVEDAREAQAGGADRLELCRDLATGGLTPAPELVRAVLENVRIPVRVMLREREGYFCLDESELSRLRALARVFNDFPVDGLVMGFLKDGLVDSETMCILCEQAPRLRVTFHHAFEDTADPLAAIAMLKRLPQVDRILTAGRSGQWPERQRRLADFHARAAPELVIVAGGGMNAATLAALMHETPIREFHTGSAARLGGRVTAALVRELVAVLQAAANA